MHLQKINLFLFSILALLSPLTNSWASSVVEYREVKTLRLQEKLSTTRNWHVTAYEDSRVENGSGQHEQVGHAKLCFWYRQEDKTRYCHLIESESGPSRKYRFIKIKDISIQEIASGIHPIFGVVVFSELPFVSDALRNISVWTYSPAEDKFQNILQSANITMDGEYKLISKFEGKSLALIAQSIVDIDAGETHFSPHKYRIKVFAYRTVEGRYSLISQYVTSGKYKSLDDVGEGQADIIGNELPLIRKLIHSIN